MACTHPLKARFRTSLEIADGLSRGVSRSLLNRPIVKSRDLLDFEDFGIIDSDGVLYDWFDIPCGRCISCRLAYSREWANRMTIESLVFDEDCNFFLTLTYDNEHVPINDQALLTARLDDVSSFMKRLRRYYEYTFNHTNIRFFSSSEYGSQTLRPHYHASLYNCPISDLKEIATNFRGDPLYSSDLINKIWGKGFVVIGKFAWNTAAYTARYIVKKLKGDAALEYSVFGLEPETTRMSRKPGIGIEFLMDKDLLEIYVNDEIVLPSVGGKCNAVKPPKIFDKKLEAIDPIRYAKIKSQRSKAAEISLQAKLDQTGYTKKEYFDIQDGLQSKANKKLLRIFQDLY